MFLIWRVLFLSSYYTLNNVSMFQMSAGQESTINVRVFSDNNCQTEWDKAEVQNDANLCQTIFTFYGKASCSNGQATISVFEDSDCAGSGREITLQRENQCTTHLDGSERSLIYSCYWPNLVSLTSLTNHLQLCNWANLCKWTNPWKWFDLIFLTSRLTKLT